MCFSATASFTSSAIIGVIGVLTLAKSNQPKEWLFASIPLLFALHQFAEGAVWLALTGDGWLGRSNRGVSFTCCMRKGCSPCLFH